MTEANQAYSAATPISIWPSHPLRQRRCTPRFSILGSAGKSMLSFLSILAFLPLKAPDYPTPAIREPPMKHFMIKYQFANGTPEEWHREIARFISALDGDPELRGMIVYRCMKNRDDSSYFHLASAADEQAVKALQQRDFFKHYTEKTRQVAGGEVVVTPIELIAETAR